MSVQAGPTFKRYAANGVATVYAIPFLLLDAADLQITLNGVPVTTGFTLSGVGNPTSSCTFSVAPTGDLLFLQVVPFQRLADYQINGDFLAQTVNRDFDRLWLAIKQLSRDSSRALTVSLLEPEGIPPLPVKAVRALKMLAFDSNGEPTTSSLTLAQLEQQPALALESASAAAASALAAGVSEGLATTAKNTAVASAAAASASAQSAANAGLQIGMSFWGYRSRPFLGCLLDDGGEYDRALYPEFVALLDAALLPVVTEAVWQSTPSARGCFVATSSTGKFRMRDLNGVSAGSLVAGGAFQRGGNAGAPTLVRDTMQAWTASIIIPMKASEGTDLGAVSVTTPGNLKNAAAADSTTGKIVTIDPSVTARTGTQTAPVHVTGAWMTRVFGVITPVGPTDFQILSDAYSALAFGYVSANQTWAIGTPLTLSHGLVTVPAKTSMEAECTTADAGYSVGAVIDMGSSQCLISGANNFGFNIEKTSTQLIVNIGAQGLAVLNKSTKAVVAMTPASWRLRLKASKS